jgi:hypothetical protein
MSCPSTVHTSSHYASLQSEGIVPLERTPELYNKKPMRWKIKKKERGMIAQQHNNKNTIKTRAS